MEREISSIIKILDTKRDEIWEAVSSFDNLNRQSDEYDYYEMKLESALSTFYYLLLAVYERIGILNFIDDIKKDYSNHSDKTKLAPNPIDGDFYSVVFSDLYKYYECLKNLYDVKGINRRDIEIKRLYKILEGTPKLVYDKKLNPQSEGDIRNEMYNLLIHVYPSASRDFPLPKGIKTYKPDIAIKELNSAIEYKYANTENECKTAIDGIFEDMTAYSDWKDWQTFFAVINMTDSFYSKNQVEEMLKQKKAVNENWYIIPVYGKGSRKKRNFRASPSGRSARKEDLKRPGKTST